MLVFIDESGYPIPNSESERPVVVSVCYDEKDSRMISRQVHALKRDVLGREQIELKGRELLNKRQYRRRPETRAFAEDFFAALRNLPITVFAIIMEGPFGPQQKDPGYLENWFRFLLQRIELLAGEREAFANVLFDGHTGLYQGVSRRFSGYIFRSDEGRASTHIADTPAFADSASSAGLQIADMCAYVIRVYHEHRLFSESPAVGDEYLRAFRRWYQIIQQQTRDLTNHLGEPRPGFYRLPQGET